MQIRLGEGTQLSGSLGGITAAKATGGITLRNRTVPTNTQSATKRLVLARTVYLNNLWFKVMTDLQRSRWETVARRETTTNSLGTERPKTGRALFLKVNQMQLRQGTAATINIDTRTNPGVTIFPSPPDITLSVANGWSFPGILPGPAASFYQLQLSPALSPGITSYRRNYAIYSTGAAQHQNFINRTMNVPNPRYGSIQAGQYRACKLTVLRAQRVETTYTNIALVQA